MIGFWEYMKEKQEDKLIYKMLRVTDESSAKELLQNIVQHKKILRCVFDDYADILWAKDHLVEYADVLCDVSKTHKERKEAFLLLRDFVWLKAINFASYDRDSGKYQEVIDPLMRIEKPPEDSFWQRLFLDKKTKGAYKAQQELFQQIQEDVKYLEAVLKAVYSEQKSVK